MERHGGASAAGPTARAAVVAGARVDAAGGRASRVRDVAGLTDRQQAGGGLDTAQEVANLLLVGAGVLSDRA